MQDRPDPDALLQRIQQEQAQQQRGRLKVFFGACAGVGKTFAMLSAARAAQAQGLPVTIGVVETHGRADTEALTDQLPRLHRLPLRALPYKDRTLPEFDLDAALAWGAANPEGLVLLDELAHSNAPGSRHPKRWQDAEELLAAGIDVWSTMNVQHLESLNDIVSGITGIRVWETVPDQFFDAADEVVVVDLPPDELLARLKAGKVYLPQQAERAAANFFRKGNLLALRELALRRTADRVDDEMRAYRRASTTTAEAVWPNREALLACVGTGDNAEKVVRSCARLAAQLDLPWHAVHVETPEQQGQSATLHPQVERTLKIAQQLGATACAVLPAAQPAQALVRYAREHNLVRVVMGRSARRWPWQATLAEQIAQRASDLDLLQVGTLPSRTAPAVSQTAASKVNAHHTPFWPGYLAAALACCIAAVIATPLANVLELTNIVMLFLLVVVGVALRFGRGPAIMAAFLGVGFFDFFFVPPRFNFAVSDAQYLVTFAVMLVVALVVGQLTAGLKVQAEAATEREHRVRSLYDMARDLSAALLPEQVAEIGARFITGEFSAGSSLVVADDDNRLQVLPGGTAPVDMAVAQWAFERGEPAGRGTDTLHSSPTLVLPLKAPMRIRGVLVVAMPQGRIPGVEPQRLLQTCASLLAISLERIHYIEVAQKSTVQIESERLRNSLLSAISHDLRTPLASLVGLAESLAMVQPPLPAHQQELTGAIQQSAQRMSALVNNLLDMARLEAGAVQLNKAWQPLEEVVGSALAASAPAIAAHRIEVTLPGDLPLLQIDSVLMERVLVNLLENAAKYTPADTTLRISAQQQSDAVALTLTDEGPGLPKGREELLFEKFERGARESATPGVGLGLAICRAIVQAHGGSIRGDTILNAQSQPAGARFTLLLPRGTPPTDLGTDTDTNSDV